MSSHEATPHDSQGRHASDLAILDAPEQVEAKDDKRRKRLIIVLLVLLGVLLMVVSLFVWYLISRKPLSQLPILGHEAMPAYKFSIYGPVRPLGVAVTPDGSKIYVTQSAGDRTVLVYDGTGQRIGELKAPASKAGHIPVYVAVNPTNLQVAVTDTLAKAVYVYDADGTYLRTVKPTPYPAKTTWTPLGVAYDKSGTLYVSDVGSTKHTVLVLDATDHVVRTLVPVDAPFAFPSGISIDDQGDVFVADSNNGRLIAFDPSGKQIGAANRGVGDGDLGLPRGVAFDNGDRIYVVDTTNQGVKAYKLIADGTNRLSWIGSFGDEGIADGLFEYPNGIATDNRSDIFITDRENGRVQVWSL